MTDEQVIELELISKNIGFYNEVNEILGLESKLVNILNNKPSQKLKDSIEYKELGWFIDELSFIAELVKEAGIKSSDTVNKKDNNTFNITRTENGITRRIATLVINREKDTAEFNENTQTIIMPFFEGTEIAKIIENFEGKAKETKDLEKVHITYFVERLKYLFLLASKVDIASKLTEKAMLYALYQFALTIDLFGIG